MNKYLQKLLLERTPGSGVGQIETMLVEAEDAGAAAQVAINLYSVMNPDDASASAFGTAELFEG